MWRTIGLTTAIAVGLLIQGSMRAQEIPNRGGVQPTTGSVVIETTLEGGGLLPRIQFMLYPTNTDVPNRPPITSFVASGATSTASRVPAGEYVVNGQQNRAPVLPAGYMIQSITAGGVDLKTNPVRVTAGESTRISIVIGVSTPPPWIKVSGRISGVLDAPVKPGSITIIGYGDMPDTTTTVDWRGSFEFPMVFPGIYQVRLDPQADPYPRKIVAKSAGEMSGDIPMMLPTFVVSGTVEGAAKQAGISTARIVPTFGNDGFPLNTGFSDTEARRKGTFASTVPLDADGSFTFSGIPRGWYTLSIGAGEMPVNITDHDILDFKFSSTSSSPRSLANNPPCSARLTANPRVATTTPVSISGTAVMNDGTPPPAFDALFRSSAGTRTVRISGETFSASLPPGDYCIGYRIPASVGIVTMMAGLTDLKNFPFKVPDALADSRPSISFVLFPHLGPLR